MCSYAAIEPPRQDTASKSKAIGPPFAVLSNDDRTLQEEHVSEDDEGTRVDGRKERSTGWHMSNEHTRSMSTAENLLSSTPDSSTSDCSVSFHLGYADSSNDNFAALTKNVNTDVDVFVACQW